MRLRQRWRMAYLWVHWVAWRLVRLPSRIRQWWRWWDETGLGRNTITLTRQEALTVLDALWEWEADHPHVEIEQRLRDFLYPYG